MLATATTRCLLLLSLTKAHTRLSRSIAHQHHLRLGPPSLSSFVTCSGKTRALFTSCVVGMSEGKLAEGDQPVKTEKQLKKEAQKREKMEKFLAKQAKKGDTTQKASSGTKV